MLQQNFFLILIQTEAKNHQIESLNLQKVQDEDDIRQLNSKIEKLESDKQDLRSDRDRARAATDQPVNEIKSVISGLIGAVQQNTLTLNK